MFYKNKHLLYEIIMKKGKTSKVQGFKTAKTIYGTVDSITLKSLYLNIQTWVEPKIDSDNWTRVVLNLSRSIKHSIYDKINDTIFDDKFIVDLDLRSSGLIKGKKSFMNLEVNFFVNDENIDFKSNEVKESIKEITKIIFDENFYKNKYFTFSLTKTNKTTPEIIQIEVV